MSPNHSRRETKLTRTQPVFRMKALVLRIVAAVVLTSLLPAASEAGRRRPRAFWKVDRAVADIIENESSGRRIRVIVRTRAGADDRQTSTARARGRQMRDHRFIRAFSAEVDPNDLADLVDDASVESVSIDAPVKAQVADTVGTTWFQDLASLAGAQRSRCQLRRERRRRGRRDRRLGHQALGRSAGDAASAPSKSPAGWCSRRSFLATTTGTARTSPASSASSGQRRRVSARRRGARRPADRAEGARRQRRRLHQRRDRGDRVRHRRTRSRSASTSSTCRSAIRSTSRRRPIRWCRRSKPRSRARHRRRRLGRQLRQRSRHGRVGYAGITSPGNAPSAITVGALNTTRHGDAQRRSMSAVQLARADVVRRLRQAGPRRAGPPAGVGDRHEQHALRDVSDARRGTMGEQPAYLRLSGTSMATRGRSAAPSR